MGRQKLERTYTVCKNPGCGAIIEVKVGSTYTKSFCSSKCANHFNKAKTKKRRRKVTYKKVDWVPPTEHYVTPTMLQDIPVGGDTGGKFARLCNSILRGEVRFTGTR